MELSPWTTATSSLLHQLSPSNSFVSSSSVDNAPTLINDADIDSCWHSFNEQTNTRLLHVLSDLVKAFVDTESDIQKNLEKMGFSSSKDSILNKEEFHPLEDVSEILSVGDANTELSEDGPDLITSSTFYSSLDLSSFSKDLSHNLNVEDDVVLGASRRLRAAVERILRLLNEIVNINQGLNVQNLIRRNDDLVNDLNEEVRKREKLTHQLLIAEKKIKIMEENKNKVNSELMDYQEIKKEFDFMKSRLKNYEIEKEEWTLEKARFEKDKSNFIQNLPDSQQKCSNFEHINKETHSSYNETDNLEGLASTVENLRKNIRSLQQENNALQDKIKLIEDKTETSLDHCDKLLKSKQNEFDDVKSQFEASEKQVASYKKFVQEQALEREAERETFIKEIESIKEKYNEKEKSEKNLKDKIEYYQTQLDLLSEEKQKILQKENDLELKLSQSYQDVAELKSILIRTEKESEKFASLEQKLIKQCNDLEEALQCQLLINDDLSRENLNNLTNSLINSVSVKTDQIKKLLNNDINQTIFNNFSEVKTNQNYYNISSFEETNFGNSFFDLQTLSEKLSQLNSCIDSLIFKNSKLFSELQNLSNEKQNLQKELNELQKEKEKLELDFSQSLRTVDLLQEELNTKHLQLSALKTRLDGTSCLDINQYKATINEYKKKLLLEESRVEILEQQIESFQNTLEEANSRIKTLVEEMQIIENLKETLELEKNDLIIEKEVLFDEKLKLSQELDNLKFKPHQKVIDNDNMVPQILQMVVKDKNEEIQDLNNQLKIIQFKLESFFPGVEKNIHLLLDEFIKAFDEYKKIANNFKPGNLNANLEISQLQSLSYSPKTLILKEKSTNTDSLFSITDYLKECEPQKFDNDQQILKKQLEDSELKNTKLCSALQKNKEKNNLFKLELIQKEKSVKDISNKDDQFTTNADESDVELIDTSLETALQKLHNQSVELLKLSENKRNQKDSLLLIIIDALSFLNSNEDDCEVLDKSKLKKKLLENFPNEELCSLVVQKISNAQELFLEYKNKLEFYLQQNEFITAQMATVEELSSKVQFNSIMFQKKYEEMKKKLKNCSNKDSPHFIISNRSELFFKYRICLSHKNSLIHQKKYLLNVLGGFQLTEKAILALLANSNVTTENAPWPLTKTKKNQFKYAVWAVIATIRIRFLKRKRMYSKYTFSHIHTGSSKLSSCSNSPLYFLPNKQVFKTNCFAKYETDATLQEFANRIKKLHRTIEQNKLELHLSDNSFSDCPDSN